MADNRRDSNRVPTIAGVDSIGFTISTEPAVDPTTHELLVKSSSTPLPTGAATSAKQDTQTTLLQGIAGFTITGYDYISMALSVGNTTETYTFKTGGVGGTTIATVVIVYTDSNREVMITATKT